MRARLAGVRRRRGGAVVHRRRGGPDEPFRPGRRLCARRCGAADHPARSHRSLGNLPGDTHHRADPAQLAADEAKAANDIRSAAAAIESPTLRADVLTLADDFDAISQSRLAATDPTAGPDKRFMGASQNMTTTIHDLEKACPGIGDAPVSLP